MSGWGWRDHIPSGYDDQAGHGQVSCSCGWSSEDKSGWVEHIEAMLDARAEHLDFCGGGEFCSLDDCMCMCHMPPAR